MTHHVPGETQIRVVGLPGSLRPAGYTRMAVAAALRGAQQLGAATRLLDLVDYELFLFDGKRPESQLPAGILRLRQALRDSHGIILGTPEYHGSFSGVLKNALDFMGFEEFEGKMIGLVGVAGGRMGALDALNGLRAVGRSLHAWVVPEKFSIPDVARIFDADGHIHDRKTKERLLAVGRQVAHFAFIHSSEQVREFLYTREPVQTID